MVYTEEQLKEALLNYSASSLTEEAIDLFPVPTLLAWLQMPLEGRLSFRTAWYVEHIFIKRTAYFALYSREIIAIYVANENWSVLRSFSKLVMLLYSKAHQAIHITEEQEEAILEKSFWIIDHSDCPVAVLVNAMDILARLVPKQEWIAHELRLRIELALEKEATPALKSRGSRILKRIANA